MDRSQKEELVASLHQTFSGTNLVIVTQQTGLTVAEASDLRRKMRDEKLIIIGGAMGETQLDPSAINSLATLPSLDELRGKLIGVLQAPATKVAGVVQAPAAQLARVFSAYSSSQGEAA